MRRGALAERGMAAGRLGRLLCVAPAECSSMCSNYTHKNHSQDMPFCIPTNRQNRGSSHDLMHKKKTHRYTEVPIWFLRRCVRRSVASAQHGCKASAGAQLPPVLEEAKSSRKMKTNRKVFSKTPRKQSEV